MISKRLQNERDKTIYKFYQERKDLTSEEIAEIFNISRRAYYRIIKKMKNDTSN
jgi:predicted DNA-binding protein YlxM (UPF0122 family)